MQKVAELHETSFASRAGSDNAPPLVEDHVEPSHARRFPFWSLAMQNEIVGHETVGETPAAKRFSAQYRLAWTRASHST